MRPPDKKAARTDCNSAGPLNENPRAKETRTDNTAESPDATIIRPNFRKKLSLRRHAMIVRGELYRLAAYRRVNSIRLEANPWCFVIAATLACGAPGKFLIPRSKRWVTWPGLDIISLRDALRNCDIGYVDDDELHATMKAVSRWQAEKGVKPLTSDFIAKRLQVTARERRECGIRMIGAIDQTRAERAQHRRDKKRKRDREQKRESRGRKPRAKYEAEGLSSCKPWMKCGMSRATWYRRQKRAEQRETSVSPNHIWRYPKATHPSQGAQAARVRASEPPERGAPSA